MEGICGEIRLTDFDILELSNLNRIRTGIHILGLKKVYAVARGTAEIDPYIKVVCYPNGLTDENVDAYFTEEDKLDMHIEESDGLNIKILSRHKARELSIPVLNDSVRYHVDVEELIYHRNQENKTQSNKIDKKPTPDVFTQSKQSIGTSIKSIKVENPK